MPKDDISDRIASLSPDKRALFERMVKAGNTPPPVTPAINEPIAVIGMGCRFPGGANNPSAFWELLKQGIDAVTPTPSKRWDADSFFDADPAASGKANTRWGAYLDQVDQFDPSFFGISPHEATRMDPQQRLLLEVAWEAFENAGQTKERLSGSKSGVFIGIINHSSEYYWMQVADLASVDVYTSTGTAHSVMANRLSYLFNLQGPSMAVDTACSSSLVSLHLAIQSLRSRESDLALAGGVHAILAPENTVALTKLNMMAPDGQCKTFDSRANGFVRGEGCGLVVLKRLSDAIADGDNILAIVRGSAVNQDGRSNGLTAPNGLSQKALLRDALKNSGVSASQISYVETHGTGTALGDPIEFEALAAIIGKEREPEQKCFLGSAKTNIGHLEAAAGIAGVIKTILCLKHRWIPPLLHFKELNPHIALEKTPFVIPTQGLAWPAEPGRRFAGVSSFGFGGTNSHVILEEAGEVSHLEEIGNQESRDRASAEVGESATVSARLLPLSARSRDALTALVHSYQELIAKNESAGAFSLSDLCYSAGVRRTHHNYRLAVVGSSLLEVREQISSFLEEKSQGYSYGYVSQTLRRGPVFVFSGHGPQWFGMGRELFKAEPVFREAVEQCDAALRKYADWSLLDELSADESRSRLNETEFAQPAIFALQLGLAALWRSWGVVADAVVGHSVGEVAGAYVAGALSFEDAIRVIFHRGRIMQQATGNGKMASVDLPVVEAEKLLARFSGKLSVAAANSPRMTVISGESAALEDLLQSLQAQKIRYRLLSMNYAFHSPLLDVFQQEVLKSLGDLGPRASLIPIYSTVTGNLCDGTVMNGEYWWRNVRNAVLFGSAIDKALDADYNSFIELGAHPVLSPAISQCLDHRTKEGTVLASLHKGQNERTSMLTALGGLYAGGYEIDWRKLYSARKGFVELPSYPWQRKSFWLERRFPNESNQMPESSPALPKSDSRSLDEKQSSVESCGMETFMENGVSSKASRKDEILGILTPLLQELSGLELSAIRPNVNFMEMGLDSLFLAQASRAFSKKFGLKISIRQMMEEQDTLEHLAVFLDENGAPGLPPETKVSQLKAAVPQSVPPAEVAHPTETAQFTQSRSQERNSTPPAGDASLMERIMREQLQIMSKQLEMLGGASQVGQPASVPASSTTLSLGTQAAVRAEFKQGDQNAKPLATAHGPFKPIVKGSTGGLSDTQQENLRKLIDRYVKRTPESKRLTQKHRRQLSDPRTVSGFKQLWKEMVYPIISARSSGAKLWDVDSNEYVDFAMGFGANLFGHMPGFVKKAIEEQMKLGMEIGPQSPLAGKVAELICELTGAERAAFCNTGSEAVMVAIRMARAVTGREKVVMFSGSFHGIFDEVLIRPGAASGPLRSLPIAPGIPEDSLRNIVLLDYCNPRSLEILRSMAPDLAAVLVEPIQARHSEHQPREFLKELRAITEGSETALIFDEIVTGFRVDIGGAQATFDIKADLATYGKVVGGGLPIGVVAGKAKFMDALDGGFWEYGDNSSPEVGVTFFAGTFIRHPLAMATAHAVLQHLKKSGPELQRGLNEKTTRLVATLNGIVNDMEAPLHFQHFGSILYLPIPPDQPLASLLFYFLREKGIHVWEGRSWVLTTAHSDADLQKLIDAFKESLGEMIAAGFLPGRPVAPRPHPDSTPAVSTSQLTPILSHQSKLMPPTQSPANGHANGSAKPAAVSAAAMKFGLYFFGNYPAPFLAEKYGTILEAAKIADKAGFSSIWIPERHFHPVGGFSPNPAVIAAALARETHSIQLRAGSVVLPLHNPIRVAEEWSVVDNLSEGRVGLSIASGWHPNDFVFAPDSFEKRRELCTEGIEIIRKLWSGQTIPVRGGNGNSLNVSLFPMPRQQELPMWLTCTQPASYEKAGELGMGVLAMLTNLSLDEMAQRISLYRKSLERHGHDPAKGNVTVLIHTFVDQDYDHAVSQAGGPMREYLRSYLDNSQKRFDAGGAQTLEKESLDYLLDRAFADYVEGKALIGTPEGCVPVVEKLQAIGVDELGCFVDFGVDPASMMAGLPQLAELKRRCDAASAARSIIEPAKDVATSVSMSTDAEIASASSSTQQVAFPLTPSQKEIWAVVQMGGEASCAFNEGVCLRMHGSLNIGAMKESIQEMVDRHETLRTTFSEDGEYQLVSPSLQVDVPVMDYSSLKDQEKKLASLIDSESQTPFDYVHGPLIKTRIVRLSERHFALIVFCHHLICDGRSMSLLLSELAQSYSAKSSGMPSRLPEAMQFREFAAWQLDQKGSPESQAAESYWTNLYSTLPQPLELPSDRLRPAMKSYRAEIERWELPASLSAGIRKTGLQSKCTLFVTLLASYAVLLHRLSGPEDLAIGISAAGQSLVEHESLVGHCLNFLPLRIKPADTTSFIDFLSSVKDVVLNGFDHQNYTFGELVRALNPHRDPSRAPLVSLVFNIDRVEGESTFFGLETVINNIPKKSFQFDFSFNFVEVGSKLTLDFIYNSDLCDAATIKRWLKHFETLLTSIVANPAEVIGKLPILTDSERKALLTEWNATGVEFSERQTLQEWFEDRVKKTPDARAVTFEEKHLTYRELNRRANQLAHHLKSLGVGPDVLVGIFAERSLEMVIGLFGVLKAGGAYLPLDPDYPKDRLAFMLKDAEAPVLLTHSDLVAQLPEHTAKVVCLDTDWPAIERQPHSNPQHTSTPNDLAYVIYTSGSTGKPKGVPNGHEGIVNRLKWMQGSYKIDKTDRVMQKTPFSFDVSVWEFFWPLMVGAELVVARPEGHKDPSYLVNLIETEHITTMHFVPSMLRMFLETAGVERCRSLRRVFCSGEALPLDLQERFFERLKGVELHNLYGPTEAAVDVTSWRCGANTGLTTVPIGKPIWNTQIYILDKQLEPVPVGVPGELHIGGTGLARGYLKRPELTAEKFIADPFSAKPGARLYKTGDLARFLADGNIEYLGRIDHQVKIRGFRIELGEIETTLEGFAGIGQCVVVAREDEPGEKRLVAYFEWRTDSAPVLSDLRAHLKQTLPDYMVPSLFVPVEKLPLTTSGKVDRQALPQPDASRSTLETTYVAPRTPIEETLAKIWRDVLRVQQVGIHDNFFDLGGDSILSIQIVSKANRAGLHLTPRHVFQYQTISELAAVKPGGNGRTPKLGHRGVTGSMHFPESGLSQKQLEDLINEIG